LDTSSTRTLSGSNPFAFLLVALLGAMIGAAAIAGPHGLVGGGSPATLAAVAAVVVGGVVVWLQASRFARRMRRLERFAAELGGDGPAPFLAAERSDALGRVEGALSLAAHRAASTIAALRVERERLEAILRGMVEGVLVTDLTGTVALLNARARELLGLPIETTGRGRALVELVRDPGFADVVRALEGGAGVVSHDVALGGGDGPLLQVNAARLRGIDGEPFGFVLVLHDVTELRRLEVVRRDFVANVSHELRTPLTAIKGYAETLLGPAGDDRDTARRFLGVIDRHSERLGRLINDLLTLSDLELGRAALRLGAVAVGTVVDDVLQILGEAGRRKGVRVLADVAPDTPPAHADGDRLRQVLINLVDNGLKYTPSGGRVLVRVRRGSGPQGGMVEIAVEDSGIGVPAQDLPRLTERFFRVDKARSRELGGTGLGLAIVKHIVQGHGGSLHIASAVGLGTTVTTYFPAAGPVVRRAS
jgi:two-component system phosphate regulon sensor histidine kinase PhoR